MHSSGNDPQSKSVAFNPGQVRGRDLDLASKLSVLASIRSLLIEKRGAPVSLKEAKMNVSN